MTDVLKLLTDRIGAINQSAGNQPLTDAERAYRRGCYQGISWMLQALCPDQFHDFKEIIKAARGDTTPCFLGRFLDECLKRLATETAVVTAADVGDLPDELPAYEHGGEA